MINKEVWRDIPDYEGIYQVSNLGNVKSLTRILWNGKAFWKPKEKILKPFLSNGYYRVGIKKNGASKKYKTSQLVAMSFLGHKPCGMKLVVDHINNDKTDNRVENLRIVTQRDNAYTHHAGSSKYKGVCFYKATKKWRTEININGKSKHLGYFNTELEAHNAYQNKLKTKL